MNRAKHGERPVAMPRWSSPLGEFPYPMDHARMMIIECTANRSELAQICPLACRPGRDNRVRVFFAENSQPPNSLKFSEVGIIQEVRYKGDLVQTMPYIWVSDDIAMIGGRELFGMPKLLMDDFPPTVHANQVFGRLSRRGVTMLEGSMTLERMAKPDEMPFADMASVYERCLPNPNPAKPARRELIRLKVNGRASVGPVWYGSGHLEVHHPLGSGLRKLGLRPSGRAWYGIFSWELPNGEIVEEFLK
jgi:acetoacetate decarboxylase